MSFKALFDNQNSEAIRESLYGKTSSDVERALGADHLTLEDFKALLSPAADPWLEEMAKKSQMLTRKRFGKTIQLYAPLYVSNKCSNFCTYCGFRSNNTISRKTLTLDEIGAEAREIKKQGIKHVLIVSGEAPHQVNTDYFLKTIKLLKSCFVNISFEVQPLAQADYERLHGAGVHAVLVYQETYNKKKYAGYHPKGPKADFYHRLESPERIGKAGMHKTGLGVLLGLDDWRIDSFFCGLHLDYLQKKFWRTKYTLSFPRIRPAEGIIVPDAEVSDRNLVQLICAYRLFNEDVELSVSTRESETFRNNILKLGATTLSAGSKTNPGGYTNDNESLEQFEICDTRDPQQIAELLLSENYDPLWKDWDKSYC